LEEETERNLFGTDGVRGTANLKPLTPEMMVRLGKAIAAILKDGTVTRRHRIVIGKDTRLSGYMLEQAMASGICSMGVDVLLVGPLPTPGIAFITSGMRADMGVVISASHNPFQDNGIKVFSRDGFKLPDDVEKRIEDLMESEALDRMCPTAERIGKAFRVDDARGRYIQFLKGTFPPDMTLDGMHIALDCANGAAYATAPPVLEELGAKVYPIAVEPDGQNINLNCGSLHPEVVAEEVKRVKADIGIALDGDADRVVFVDEHGNVVDGDGIMAVCAMDMLAAGRLKRNTIVATVMSNIGLERVLERAGGKVVRTRVGDRYVVEKMRTEGYNFGGEQSGHLIYLDHTTTGDGMIGALQILAVMLKTRKPLSELAAVLEKCPQCQKNIPVREKKPFDQMPEVTKAIRRVEQTLGNDGRVLVRYSGTELKARILVEGLDTRLIEELTNIIAEAIQRDIGI